MAYLQVKERVLLLLLVHLEDKMLVHLDNKMLVHLDNWEYLVLLVNLQDQLLELLPDYL